MKFDVIYSVLFHQNINFINNFLVNLNYFNKNNKYLVIIHLTDRLFKKQQKINKINCLVNPNHFNKESRTISISKAIFENFKYIIKKKIISNYIIPISSRVIFIKQAPKFIFYNNKYINNKKNYKFYCDSKLKWINNFKKNIKLINYFKKNKINLTISQLSGYLFNYNSIKKIYKFIINNKIFRLIENDNAYFDEILFNSLANYFNNINYKLFCKRIKYKDINNKLNDNIFMIKII
jgi:hypothetical protein